VRSPPPLLLVGGRGGEVGATSESVFRAIASLLSKLACLLHRGSHSSTRRVAVPQILYFVLYTLYFILGGSRCLKSSQISNLSARSVRNRLDWAQASERISYTRTSPSTLTLHENCGLLWCISAVMMCFFDDARYEKIKRWVAASMALCGVRERKSKCKSLVLSQINPLAGCGLGPGSFDNDIQYTGSPPCGNPLRL